MLVQGFFLTTMDEEEVEGVLERFPKLGERVRDWVVIAKESSHIVVHIIIEFNQAVVNRLKARPEYLGSSYREIAQRAKAGDLKCKQVLERILFTSWEIDNPELEGPGRIPYFGNLGEWKEAGRPERLSKWQPIHVWLGQDVAIPSNTETEDG